MVKIRLHGELDEVEAAVEELKKSFEILSVSSPYQDRNSVYCRLYLDVNPKKKTKGECYVKKLR